MKKQIKSRLWFGLGVLSLGSLISIIAPIASNYHQLNASSDFAKTKFNDESLIASRATNNNTLSTNNYTPVLSSQHTIATTTSNGYLGAGYGDIVINNDGDQMTIPGSSSPMVDDKRAITFTTYDGVLRWKFDFNELLPYKQQLGNIEIGDLRVVDIKPLHNNEGYLVLATGCGYLKTAVNYDDNVLFILNNNGEVVESSLNYFSLPIFGTIAQLVGNKNNDYRIISPYSLKISKASSTKALIQISANPFAIKNNNSVDRWKVGDFLSTTAINNSFDPDTTDQNAIRTTPVVLLQFDYNKKSFDYEDSTQQANKVLKNYTPLSTFEDLIRNNNPLIPTDAVLTSDLIFYVKNGILGFYASLLEPGTNAYNKYFDISTYVIQSNKFLKNNTILRENIDDTNGRTEILNKPDESYSGYTFSYIPFNYFSSPNAPAGELIVPFDGGFYLFSLYDATKSGEKKFTNWKVNNDKNLPSGSFIDPLYGNIFMLKNNNQVDYVDLTFETADGNSIPNVFSESTFNVPNLSGLNNALENVDWIYPITSSNNVYDQNSQYFKKFAFATFDKAGGFRVLSFNPTNASNLEITINPSNDVYRLETFVNLQKRSETLGWTPHRKKLSEIADARLATIGNYQTVAADADIDDLPLFYSTIAEGQKSLYPLNTLKVENIVRDYKNATLTFDANFSYTMYASNDLKTYSQSYAISGFLIDQTSIKETVYNMPSMNENNQPLVISSPLVYQGYYDANYDYKTGDQIAFYDSNLGDQPFVYEAKIDKPKTERLYDDAGSFNLNVFNKYFSIVKNYLNEKQTPYEFKVVDNYKGIYNSNIEYQVGDIVRDTIGNKLYIFKTKSSSLIDTSPYYGTDLSTLLPSDLTTNHVAMLVVNQLVDGTIPDGFNNSNVEVSSFVVDNTGDLSPLKKGIITANIRLKKYYNDAGILVTSPAQFPHTAITINFANVTKPTSMIENYTVQQFGTILNNMYAYQVDGNFLSTNTLFLQQLVSINQNAGYFSNDIDSSVIQLSAPQADNASGTVSIQVSLSRWYDQNGVLNNTDLRTFFIQITGFKQATPTVLTSNDIVLRPDQLNVPGLSGLPNQTTVGQFIAKESNIKKFILEYVDINTNTKLIRDDARPAGFSDNSIEIINIINNSPTGEVIINFVFRSYFISQTIGGQEKVVYREGVSSNFSLKIGGFKPYVDNTIDTFNYDLNINIDSSVNANSNWPQQLSSKKEKQIPSQFYDSYKNSIDEILKSTVIALFSSSTIDGNENKYLIQGFGINDIGNVESVFYNNFTGKIIFKINLKRIVTFDEIGNKTLVDNSTNYNDWSTNPKCQYTVSLEGFKSVKSSTINEHILPSNPNKEIVLNGNFTINNENIVNITDSDLVNLINFNGSWGIYVNNSLVVEDSFDLLNDKYDIFVDKNGRISKDIINSKIKITYELKEDLYIFTQTNNDANNNNPFELGNLGTPIKLAKGTKIIINNINVSKKINVWEILFWVGIGIAAVILISLAILIIVKLVNRRKIY